MNPQLVEVKELPEEKITWGVNPRNRCSEKMTTSSFVGEGTGSSPGARALTLDGRRPASRYAFSCSAVIVDPPQSAEIDRFDVEDLAAAAAAAAMLIVLLDVEALALEAALERLGAMACVRSAVFISVFISWIFFIHFRVLFSLLLLFSCDTSKMNMAWL